MAEDKNKEIIKRLDLVIGLFSELISLLSTKYDNKFPEMIRIARLNKLGLKNQEIALLLDKTSKDVSNQIYKAKRVKVSKKSKGTKS